MTDKTPEQLIEEIKAKLISGELTEKDAILNLADALEIEVKQAAAIITPVITDPVDPIPVSTDPAPVDPTPVATDQDPVVDPTPIVTDPVVTDPSAGGISDPQITAPITTDPSETQEPTAPSTLTLQVQIGSDKKDALVQWLSDNGGSVI